MARPRLLLQLERKDFKCLFCVPLTWDWLSSELLQVNQPLVLSLTAISAAMGPWTAVVGQGSNR